MCDGIHSPFVFLLDLDGTMQGNVIPQLNQYSIEVYLNSLTRIENKIKYNSTDLYSDMEHGLIRPHLRDSILSMKKKHPNIEFFIYTASDDNWAEFIIPKVVTYLFGNNSNIINKPYFTRKHCHPSGMKLICNVRTHIEKSLKNKYKKPVMNNIFLVDNNVVLGTSEIKHLIHCSTYNYTQEIDVLRNIKSKIIKTHVKEISEVILNKAIPDLKKFMFLYNKKMDEEIVMSDKLNEMYLTDEYWLEFSKIVVSHSLKTQQNVSLMVRKLRLLK
jgi:hypothetical protein